MLTDDNIHGEVYYNNLFGSDSSIGARDYIDGKNIRYVFLIYFPTSAYMFWRPVYYSAMHPTVLGIEFGKIVHVLHFQKILLFKKFVHGKVIVNMTP